MTLFCCDCQQAFELPAGRVAKRCSSCRSQLPGHTFAPPDPAVVLPPARLYNPQTHTRRPRPSSGGRLVSERLSQR